MEKTKVLRVRSSFLERDNQRSLEQRSRSRWRVAEATVEASQVMSTVNCDFSCFSCTRTRECENTLLAAGCSFGFDSIEMACPVDAAEGELIESGGGLRRLVGRPSC